MVRGYVIHPTYITQGDPRKPTVTLYARLEDGRSAIIKADAKPFFYIHKSDAQKAAGLLKDFTVEFEDVHLQSFERKTVIKITADIPASVPKIREKLEKEDIPCLEADVRFSYRFMMDKDILSVFELEGKESKPSENEHVDVIFENPDIKGTDSYVPTLSTLSFDIESNKHDGEILSLSMSGMHKGKLREEMLILSEEKVKGAKNFAKEGDLITEFCNIIIDWDPDVILGWNVVDFDLQLLQHRAKLHKVSLPIGRNSSEMKLRIESSYFRQSQANITGRIVIDGIHALRDNYIKLPDYKLATAAREFTDHKKLIETTGKEKYEEIMRLYHEDKPNLLKYNLEDARLVNEILDKSGVFKLTIKRSLLTGMPLDRVTASIASVDSLYLRELHQRGFVANSVINRRRDNEGVGGFVMKSKPGIYDYVIVCDFKSLYPSIMRTFNIDPLMFVDEPSQKDKKELIESPNGAHFRRDMGIIPGLIQSFWDEREAARKKGDELARYAIKIQMNSMYGVLASPNSRYFNRQVGNSITGFAQFFIKMTAEKVREMSYEVIYGDTDSLFINLDVDDYEQSQKLGKQIQDDMNKMLKEYIKERYQLDSFLELEFEKTFIRFVMPKVRGSDAGAKKRYAGLVRKEDGTEKISYTGLEMVRRDWTDLAKEFQGELYRRVFAKEEVAEYVRDFIKDLKEGVFDDKLVYRKALRKGVDEYTKTTPPHVKAAMKLESEIENNLIEYVITTDGPEPVQNIQHSLDYDHYIDKQLKPIADSLLAFYGTSFEDQMKGTSQASLFDF